MSRIAKFRDIDTSDKHYSVRARSSESAEIFRQGTSYYEAGDYSSAESCFRKLLELNPDDCELHFYMARFYVFKGNPDKAQEEYLLALRYATSPRTVVYILADIEDDSQPVNSKSFKDFANVVKSLRSHWVERFGEEIVTILIDPMISFNINDVIKKLVYDCTEMKRLMDKNNAAFILMTYPYYTPDKFRLPPDIYTRIANYLDIPLIDNNAFFNRYLKYYRKEELFVEDGHCNSKGYSLMAQNVAAELEKYNLLP